MKSVSVVGARPNFVKIASLVKAMQRRPQIENVLVHTGQHYDASMSQQFFDDLEIPRPDINLGIGSGTHASQTAEILQKFESLLYEIRPEVVIVVGDVNSTLACTLAAKKIGIDVAHVEAGLRSFDRTMPEEINRVVVDAIADFHFITEESAERNLLHEGVAADRIFFVGNVMVDTLLAHRARAENSSIRARLGVTDSVPYALVTLHRPSNVDRPEVLHGIVEALLELALEATVIFPIHPRTRRQIHSAGLENRLESAGVKVIEPLGYLDFLHLMSHARLVITDSGGIQEETTVLGVPCLTVRENTERPVTIAQGTNQLVGANPRHLADTAKAVLRMGASTYTRPKFWDGRAAERIVEVLLTHYAPASVQSASFT